MLSYEQRSSRPIMDWGESNINHQPDVTISNWSFWFSEESHGSFKIQFFLRDTASLDYLRPFQPTELGMRVMFEVQTATRLSRSVEYRDEASCVGISLWRLEGQLMGFTLYSNMRIMLWVWSLMGNLIKLTHQSGLLYMKFSTCIVVSHFSWRNFYLFQRNIFLQFLL